MTDIDAAVGTHTTAETQPPPPPASSPSPPPSSSPPPHDEAVNQADVDELSSITKNYDPRAVVERVLRPLAQQPSAPRIATAADFASLLPPARWRSNKK